MKNEAEYCTCIVHSLNNIGIGFKIPDPSGNFVTTKRCFDIIGRIDNKPVYIEAKFNNKLSSFNLKRIEKHQYEYLNEFCQIDNSLCYICFGMNYGRGDIRSFVFDWNLMKILYEKDFSFHQKHLEKLPYNKIKKNEFLFENIIDSKVFEEKICLLSELKNNTI